MVELGFGNVAIANWFGIVASTGTTRNVVSRLDLAFQQFGEVPELRKRLEALGLDTVSARPEEFAALIRPDFQKWNKVARDAGLKPE